MRPSSRSRAAATGLVVAPSTAPGPSASPSPAALPRAVLPAALLALFLAGCAPDGTGDETEAPASPRATQADPADWEPFSLPSSPTAWQGELPCADCEGILTTLLLDPDGTFRKDEAYRGLPASRAAEGDTLMGTFGRWTLEADDRRIRVDGGPDGPRYFRVASGGALRALDTAGDEIETEQNLELARLSSPPSLDGRIHTWGHFRYMADAALFVPCSSGVQLPVAMEGGYLALERAYLDRSGPGEVEPGAPWPVRLHGSVEARPAMEGDGTERSFVVEAFEPGTPPRGCPGAEVAQALDGVTWRLVALDGEPVEDTSPPGDPSAEGAGEEAQEPPRWDRPTLEWSAEDGRLAGTGGCNRFTGPGVLRGSQLVATGALASTMRYCEGAMELEQAYTGILAEGGSLRIDDGTLRLFQGPRERARFERE